MIYQSTYRSIGIIDSVAAGIVLLTLCLVLTRWFSGQSIGNVRIPELPEKQQKRVNIIAPVLLAVSLALFYPYWEKEVMGSTSVTISFANFENDRGPGNSGVALSGVRVLDIEGNEVQIGSITAQRCTLMNCQGNTDSLLEGDGNWVTFRNGDETIASLILGFDQETRISSIGFRQRHTETCLAGCQSHETPIAIRRNIRAVVVNYGFETQPRSLRVQGSPDDWVYAEVP